MDPINFPLDRQVRPAPGPIRAIMVTGTSNPSRLPLLPPELIIIILRHLRRNKSSLSSCSLVCRQWTSVAQAELFSRINLKAGRGLSGEDSIPRLFLEFLRAAPHICHYITKIIVGAFGEHQMGLIARMDSSHLLSIIRQLPQLSDLTLVDIRLIKPTIPWECRNPLVSLRHLRLVYVFPEEGCLPLLFDVLSVVGTLSLFRSTGYDGSGFESDIPLRSLEMEELGAASSSFLNLLQHKNFPNLTTLGIVLATQHQGEEYAALFRNFFARHGWRLRTFQLDMTPFASGFGEPTLTFEGLHDFLPLRKFCPNLRTLHLAFRSDLSTFDGDPESSHALLDFIVNITSSLPKTLSSLIINIDFSYPLEDNGGVEFHVDWKNLADSLEGALPSTAAVKVMHYTGFLRPQFWFHGRDGPLCIPLRQEYQDYFSEKFSSLKSRGALSFD